MKQDIRIRTAKFIFLQGAILIGIMLAFFILCSVFFVRNATRWHLYNIEQALLIFADQAAKSGEVPRRGDLGPYSFFIINETDGKYVLPRFPRPDESERYWREYEAKLVYEMQKRRDGWSYYPDRRRMDWGNGQFVLRYVPVSKQGWIVVAEGYVPGVFSLLQGIITLKMFFGMFLIIAAAFAFMIYNASWHFHRVVRAILRAQENNFIATETLKPPVEGKPFLRPDEGDISSGVIRGGPSQSLPRKETFSEPAVSAAPHPVMRKEVARNVRELDELGKAKIDTNEIRTPLLRKVIEEMREPRK